MASLVRRVFEEGIESRRRFLEASAERIVEAAERLSHTLAEGGKVILFGNGGSAADAQHLAAEFVTRYRKERRALPAIALTTDTSVLTSIGNDYGFEEIFSRQIEALGQKGDIAVAISTSGNSPNVLRGVEAARQRGMETIGLTGGDGGKLAGLVDLCLCVSETTATGRIQEIHITIGHLLCELIEWRLFEVKNFR
ncbi:MAG: D-sedoheptulose 7-phosphate isomerase [Deltaproteobacteria bacterium]|nr:MAG: D-sedoheptulose 7-phosphate isomerase [Deltaproteobacteria bacterium]